jgi:hypothetical protein
MAIKGPYFRKNIQEFKSFAFFSNTLEPESNSSVFRVTPTKNG